MNNTITLEAKLTIIIITTVTMGQTNDWTDTTEI